MQHSKMAQPIIKDGWLTAVTSISLAVPLQIGDETRLPFSAPMKLTQTHQCAAAVEQLSLERTRREAIGENQ